MKNFRFRFIISGLCLASIFTAVSSTLAAPVRLNQVVQVINAKPGKASTGNFSQLRLVNDYSSIVGDDDDETTTTSVPTQDDDDRVITDTRTEIVEETVCDCEQPPTGGGSFPYWVAGFGAIPLLFLIPGRDRDKTPTPTTPTTQTPTPTPPEPVPEPMTLLLFGTGLAGIGVAARKKFGKKGKTNTEN